MAPDYLQQAKQLLNVVQTTTYPNPDTYLEVIALATVAIAEKICGEECDD